MFSRRAVLMQLAAIPITLPLARRLYAQSTGAPPPKRLVIFMCNNGTKRGNFWPAPPTGGAGVFPLTNTPILNVLFTNDGKTDNGLKAKTNVIRGLQVVDKGGAGGNQHDIGFAQMFTGVPITSGPDGKPWGNGISFDQVLANEWKVPSFTTAVLASQVESHPKPGFNHRLSFSYKAPKTLNVPYTDPFDAYTKVFPAATGSAGGTSATAAMARLMRRQSVLDAVTGDLQDLATRLGPDDNKKLDFHLSAIRDAETNLSRLVNNTGGGGMGCASATQPKDYKTLPGGAANLVSVETYVPDMVDAFVGMMSAALKCGLTRIASLQFGYGGGKWAFGWTNINNNHHDNIAHRDTSDSGTDQVSQQVTTINQWYAGVVRKLAVDLNAASDGNGQTMLDNTLIIWSNELGRGDHQLTDIPMVLVGLVGNGIKQGNRLIDVSAGGKGQKTHNIVGYHALNALGYQTPGWGDLKDASALAIPNF